MHRSRQVDFFQILSPCSVKRFVQGPEVPDISGTGKLRQMVAMQVFL